MSESPSSVFKQYMRRLLTHCAWVKMRIRKRQISSINKRFLTKQEVLASENDPEKCKGIVEGYLCDHPDMNGMLREQYEAFARSWESPLVNESFYDAVYCFCAYGFGIDEYFVFRLANRSPQERRSFASNKDKDVVSRGLNDISYNDWLSEKDKTYEHYKKYYKREAVCIRSKADESVIRDFIERHKVCIAKRIDGDSGKAIWKIDDSCFDDWDGFLDDLTENKVVLVEELIRQSAYMASLNESSVNTVRAITFNTSCGVDVPFCFLKIGRKGSLVDNGALGGVMAGINPKDGTVETLGYTETGAVYVEHPDSGIALQSIVLPDWDSLISVAKKATSSVPELGYVSWDFAHTDNGWVIVEGNSAGLFLGPQTTYQKGIREDVIAEVRKTEYGCRDVVIHSLAWD